MKNLIKRIIPSFLLNWYHFLLAFLGVILYRFPSKKIKVIGVAGTDGKSTVVHLSTKILEETGYKIASFSSIRFKIGDKEWPNTLKMTMPGRLKIQKFLRTAVDAKCQYAVLEVTDEGIKQHRHRFIDFDGAVLTNITPEHIEAHGSFEKMREMNGKLFQTTKGFHIINLDDDNAEYFLKFPAEKKYLYQFKNQKPKIKIVHRSHAANQDSKILKIIEDFELNLKLPGEFNIYNALAAICVGLSQGVDLETCQKTAEKVEIIPGRMEVVIEKPFKVIVDYAHTPNALQKVYETIESWKATLRGVPLGSRKIENSRTICVFGACGGSRDKWKRPEFGKIAARHCDKIILTNEDPYDENPNQILSMIKSGIQNSKFKIQNLYEILDRRNAIREALKLAQPNDVVIITGKGCEPWICAADGKKIPWDDRQIVREEFEKLF